MRGNGNPQTEDGHTRIANELYDAALLFPFNRNEYKVLFAIMRATYGYGKKTDDMTVTQLAERVGISRSRASEALASLVACNAVRKTDGRHGYLLSVNKFYRQWKRPESERSPSGKRTRPENGNGASGIRTHNRQSQKKDGADARVRAREGLVDNSPDPEPEARPSILSWVGLLVNEYGWMPHQIQGNVGVVQMLHRWNDSSVTPDEARIAIDAAHAKGSRPNSPLYYDPIVGDVIANRNSTGAPTSATRSQNRPDRTQQVEDATGIPWNRGTRPDEPDDAARTLEGEFTRH